MLNAVRITLLCLIFAMTAQAGVLPEDRADVMYHRYDGGGVTIDGPSLLIRKSMFDNTSISLNHYVDNVSSASIDVKASGASRYTEERKENSLGLVFLNNNTTINFGYTDSKESDYLAKTTSFGISQDFFGNLSTLALSYSQGDDLVRKNIYDPQSGNLLESIDMGTVDRQNYRISFSQVTTKNLVLSATVETIVDEGYLNNPYRFIRFVDPNSAKGWTSDTETYPETKSSDAFAFRGSYFWPWWPHAALKFEARAYSDSWGVKGKTYELKYTQGFDFPLIVEGKVRRYNQTAAEFYSDLFPFVDAQNFQARDKELSTYATTTIGYALSYEWKNIDFGFVDKASISFYHDYIQFVYDDFRDASSIGFGAGSEPLYEFDADVFRLIFSVYY